MDVSESDGVEPRARQSPVVIVRLRLSVAKVKSFTVSCTPHGGQVRLHFKDAVIGSETDAKRGGWRQCL